MADARSDPAGVTDSTRGTIRQTASAWVDVGSTGLYPGARPSEQEDSSITEAMHPSYLRQHCQSRLAACRSPSVGMGADLVDVPSWTRSTGSWGRTPLAATTTGLPPDVSMEHWRMGFIPDARGTRPLVRPVGALQLNHVAAGAEVTGNSQSGGHQGNASSHQAPVLQRDRKS